MLILLCPFRVHGLAIDENTGSNWKRYTAFDGQVRKMMEGERYVYIWAHQQLYSKGNNLNDYYTTPHGTVLYIDKDNPSKGVRGVADDFATSGLDAKCVAYNPDRGVLVMAYTNGVVDIVRDGGEVHTVRDFDGLNGGMSINPLNINFDKVTGDIWIATSNGFVRIDGNKFTATDSADWGKSVNSICRVGDRVVAIVDNTIYEASVSTDLQSLGNLKAHSGLASKIHGIMPMGDNVFATLTESKDLSLATISSQGDITLSPQASDAGFSGQLIPEGSYVTGNVINFNYILNDEYDNNFVLTRDGYLAMSKTHLYLLKYNSGTKKIDVSKRKFNTDYVSSLARQAGSYDFENFWFYDLRKGFYCAQATGYDNSTAWTTDAERIQWQGPVAMQNAQLQYSSSKGMICMNRPSIGYLGFTTATAVPMLMSGFKDGKWDNYTPIYEWPEFCGTSSTANTQFNNTWRNYTAYPVNHANNFQIDSENPNYAIIGSMRSGFLAMNINNVRGEIIHLSHVNDATYKSYPGFSAVFPAANYPVCNICGTDADGNLWIYYPDHENSTKYGTGVKLFYWNRSSRNEAFDSQSVSQGVQLGHLFYPFEASVGRGGYFSTGIALRHPGNRGKLVITPGTEINPIIIIDHKGTLENSADDEVKVINHFSTSLGIFSNKGTVYGKWEDPVTGEVIITIDGNLIKFHPDATVTGNTIEAQLLNIRNGHGSVMPVVTNTEAYSVCFDEYNRMWIGTSSNGIYGLSANRDEVIAHYTTENSPLLSNTIYDVCWNPDTKELFLASGGGIMSMSPWSEGRSCGNIKPSVEPTLINPDYTGVVRLHNIPADASINVEDSTGKSIVSLAASVNNQAVWDTCDADGNLVPAGEYIFRDMSGKIESMRVTILR